MLISISSDKGKHKFPYCKFIRFFFYRKGFFLNNSLKNRRFFE